MAAVSVLKDIAAECCLDDILHSMLNIEDKLQDSDVTIKYTGQQSSINSFFQTAVSCSVAFILKKMFSLKYFFYLIMHNYIIN